MANNINGVQQCQLIPNQTQSCNPFFTFPAYSITIKNKLLDIMLQFLKTKSLDLFTSGFVAFLKWNLQEMETLKTEVNKFSTKTL